MFELLPNLSSGIGVTICITLASIVGGTALSLLAGLGRLSSNRIVGWTTAVYVEIFRGTSLLVQLFWMFFVLPTFGINLEPWTVAILALSLNTGAYGSEIVRGAILAVPKSQREAAIALNMRSSISIRRIVLPQAIVVMLLPWGNLIITVLKSTALMSLITVHDLAFQAYNLNNLTFRTWEIYGLTLIIYFCLSQALMMVVRLLYGHTSRHLTRGVLR